VARIEAIVEERGLGFAEIVRTAVGEYLERHEKLVPRQGRQRAAPTSQTRMPLEQQA
jgi:hypothetical protein